MLEIVPNIMSNLLTPNHVLNKEHYEKPAIIFPNDFKSFGDLYIHRDLIRHLELVPIKSDEMHKKYHATDKEELMASIDFSNNNIIFMENKFPYMLPEDVSQNIIWVKDGTKQSEVLYFLYNKILEHGLDSIIFERPNNITTKLVKGSFPFIRHIHFWCRKD